MSAFIEFGNMIPGVVDQNDRNSDHKPRDVRAKLYKQMPNEYMERYPLTKMVLSQRGKTMLNSKVEWGMEAFNDYTLALGLCYTDSGLSAQVGVSAGTVGGSTIYIKMAEAQAKKARALEEMEVRHCATTGIQGTVMVDIVAVTLAGASSYVQVTTLETDSDNVLGKSSLLCGTLTSLAVPNGSGLPPGRFVEATMKHNFSQIIMSGLSLTGSELADVTVFDEDTYNTYLRQCHDDYNRQVERMLKVGVRGDTTATVNIDGYNQTVKRYKCGGLRWAHKTLGGNYIRIPETTSFGGLSTSGKTWANVGYDFMKVLWMNLSKKSGSKKIMMASAKTILDICNMFEAMTNVTIGSTFKNAWGFEVTEIRGLNCKVELLQDADLSINSAWEDMVFIVEPNLIELRPRKGRDMTLIRSQKDLKKAMQVENGFTWRDAVKEGIVSDFSVTYDNLDGMAVIEGWGRNFSGA